MPIRFRKAKSGPEQQLVDRFLESYRDIFAVDGLEITALIEPYAEVGIPDILLIVWEKGWQEKWHPERNNLNKTDIKIIHYISTFGKRGTTKDAINTLLSFPNRELEKTFDKLLKADLITVVEDRIKLKDISHAFFIRQIISVEAKINDWKNAVLQAQRNQNFCSHSYLLLPEERINENVLQACDNKLGLLIYSGGKAVVKKRAQKNQIPGSYFSWMLNEYLGRQNIVTAS